MRTNPDFSPFYRSSIGFDRVFNLLENATLPQTATTGRPMTSPSLAKTATSS